MLQIGGPGGPPFVWWRGQLKSKHKVPRLRVPIRKRIDTLRSGSQDWRGTGKEQIISPTDPDRTGGGRPRLHPLLDLDLELQIPFDRAQRRLFLCCAYSHPQKIPAQAELGRGTLADFSSLTADPSLRSG